MRCCCHRFKLLVTEPHQAAFCTICASAAYKHSALTKVTIPLDWEDMDTMLTTPFPPMLILNAAMEGIKAACSLQKYPEMYEKFKGTQSLCLFKKSILMKLHLLEMNAGWNSGRGDGLGSRLK